MLKKPIIVFMIFLVNIYAVNINITYNYDTINRLTAVSYTSGKNIDYAYDSVGNISHVSHNGTEGEGRASLSLDQTALSFGNQVVGSESIAKTITVTNTGTADLTGLSISEQSSQYRQTHTCSSTLAMGASCQISVYFKPTATGLQTATLSIDASNATVQNVTLSGTGTQSTPTDTDGDGYNDDVDAFPNDSNEWLDTDSDGIGNNADTDDDGDGISDVDEIRYGLNPLNANDATQDTDGDGVSNINEINAGTDPMDANSYPIQLLPLNISLYDSVELNQFKYYKVSALQGQMITIVMSELSANVNLYVNKDSKPTSVTFNCRPFKGGTMSEVCSVEALRDLDIYIGVNGYESGSYRLDAFLDKDTDADGIVDSQDDDDDNDGILDWNDAFPLNANEWLDTDRDGVGNNADRDDDNDGILDVDEIKWGFDPLDASDGGNADADNDGVSNADEIEAGSDPLDPTDTLRPKRFAPIMMDGIVTFIPLN